MNYTQYSVHIIGLSLLLTLRFLTALIQPCIYCSGNYPQLHKIHVQHRSSGICNELGPECVQTTSLFHLFGLLPNKLAAIHAITKPLLQSPSLWLTTVYTTDKMHSPSRPVSEFLSFHSTLLALLADSSYTGSPIRRLRTPNSTRREPAPAVQVSVRLPSGTPSRRFTCKDVGSYSSLVNLQHCTIVTMILLPIHKPS